MKMLFALMVFQGAFSCFAWQGLDSIPPKAEQVVWIVPNAVDSLEIHSRHQSLQPGFRIQIFLGPFEDAKKAKQSYQLTHTGESVYMNQNIPDYTLRVGNYKTRKEANLALKTIRREIPSAFIVNDQIEPPRIVIKNPENKN
jgi:hypothetical protein